MTEDFILYRQPKDPYAEALFKGKVSVEDFRRHFGISETAAAQALTDAQNFYRNMALDHFYQVTKPAGSYALLPYQAWIPVVSEAVSHLLIVGETGSGKSYLAKSILCVRSWKGRVVVLDPHAIQPSENDLGDWGVVSVGAGRQYSEITDYMDDLVDEMNRRYNQRSQGITGFQYLNIFIDEWPCIADNCPNASKFMKTLSREGRKVNMRLTILSQSERVKSLGLSGEGDTKENFSILYLGKYAAKHLPEQARGKPRVGCFAFQGVDYPLSTNNLNQILDPFFDLTLRKGYATPLWVERAG